MISLVVSHDSWSYVTNETIHVPPIMVLVLIKWFNNQGLFIYFFCNFILKYLHGGGLVGGGGIYEWFFGGFV
jgi:hypothetical protein